MTTIVTRTGKGSPLTHVEVDTNFTNLNTAKLENLAAAAGAGSAAAPSISFAADTNTGLFNPAADTLAFAEGGAEAMRIDSSGRLLVGTTTTSSTATIIAQGSNGGAAAPGVFRACHKTTPANDELFAYYLFGDSTHCDAAYIAAARDGGTWTSGTSHPTRLVFSSTADGASSPTERMRITSAGELCTFNGTSTHLRLCSSLASGAANRIIFGAHSATAPLTGTECFRVWTNGNVENTNNSYGSLSDIKLKENIVNSGSQWNDIKSLQVRKYNFKEETGHQTHTQIGLVAQEVELVSPGLVSESPDRETIEIPVLDSDGNQVLDQDGNPQVSTEERETGTVTKSVNYSVLYMKAVKALQEAMERIEQLESAVTTLQGS